jgi:hypothetical protein
MSIPANPPVRVVVEEEVQNHLGIDKQAFHAPSQPLQSFLTASWLPQQTPHPQVRSGFQLLGLAPKLPP